MQLINYVAVIFVFCVIGFDRSTAVQEQNYANVSELIDSLLSGYDKRLRPNYGGPPVNIDVTMYVISFDSLSHVNMDYSINFYFRQFWNDPRLAFNRTGIEALSFGHEFSKSIWLPDTFFVNEKQGFSHSITAKNEFVKVLSTGEVIRSVRLSITANCPMDYTNFPMDRQICPLSIESYGYTASDIKYSWKNEHAVGISEDSPLNLFGIIGHRQNSEYIHLTTGNYSRLNLQFELKRNTSHYLTQVYVPCIMLVILSWISFWLNRRAANVRLVICALSLLLMPIGLQLLSIELPKTAYIKAIDVYTGVSMTFVFLAMVEFAYVSNVTSDKEDISSQVDLIFRYGYAALFVIFNIVYWLVY